MKLEQKLVAHRRCRKYGQILRRIRIRIFDYEDESPEKYAKACRIMELCKDRCREQWGREQRARENRIAETVYMSGGAFNPYRNP